MKTTNNFQIQDNKTTQGLISHIEIRKTSYEDAVDIISILKEAFDIQSDRETLRQLLYSQADLDNSIKIIDKRDNKIYGILILSKYNILQGSPIMRYNPMMGELLQDYSQINGHSFVIDKRLRGTDIHKEMLNKALDYVLQYDFIWCGVEKKLKSHSYWKRLGFEEILTTDEASFYVKTKDKNLLRQIFILKMVQCLYEKNNNN